MSSREKISVQDQSKERKTLGPISVGDEESGSASEGEEPDKSSGRGQDTRLGHMGVGQVSGQ